MVNRRLTNQVAEQSQQSPGSQQSEIGQDLDTVLLNQALARGRSYIFGAANLPRSRPPELFDNAPRLKHVELLNTLREFHILLLQQKAQLEDLRCQITGLHGLLGKLSYHMLKDNPTLPQSSLDSMRRTSESSSDL